MDNKKEQERDELHRAIWAIADELRGSVDGWDFKNYVLGTMFYRYISENLLNYINEGEHEFGDADFDYAKMSDADAEEAREGLIQEKGFFILPSELFCNVCDRAAQDDNLNETLETVFRHIEESAKGSVSENSFAGLFDDFDVNSNKLGATVAKRNEKLRKLLWGVRDMKLGEVKNHDIDAFGDAYEYLMTMYASNAGKSGGEFFTPADVSELLTRLGTVGKTEINKVYEKTLPTLIQTNETKKSTQIDAFFESKPKIDAFLKIDANAQSRNTKWHPDQRLWKQDAIFICFFIQSGDTPAMHYIPADTSLVFLRFPWHRIDDGRKYQLLPGGRSIVARDHGVSRAQSDASARGQSFHKQNNS